MTAAESLSFGYGRHSITPDRPLPLAGISGKRMGLSGGDDLYIRALHLTDGEANLVLLSLDVLYVSRRFCERLETWLWGRHRIPSSNQAGFLISVPIES